MRDVLTDVRLAGDYDGRILRLAGGLEPRFSYPTILSLRENRMFLQVDGHRRGTEWRSWCRRSARR